MEFIVKETYLLNGETRRDYPPVDIYEREDAVVFVVELPGVLQQDVLAKVYNNLLVIEGVKKQHDNEKKGMFICMEREFSRFRRIIPVPVTVAPDKADAVLKDGILRITLPKAEDRVYKIKILKE
ncbi:spore protein SP21 [bacterium BMS3Bbin06]|nr:spore protein SP21 [bacterium BMS3Abin08]GBE33570.1 spore protein SP21 [bacterium BMS3Bbin06]HDO35370.1 Hsp20/alpha crystallin family protein [Nitrospirota bacterium]HDY70126.1 Hsp20/alpha crystallin family protein [Nitrospirota bacterium]